MLACAKRNGDSAVPVGAVCSHKVACIGHNSLVPNIHLPVELLQEAALAALPPKLREAADKPDMTPFPLERMVPTHTPPIKGFGDRGRNPKLQQ